MTTAPNTQAEGNALGRPEQLRITASLTDPMLAFDLAAEIEQLHRDALWLKNGRLSKLLAKHSDFRILLMIMKPGVLMQEHKTDARISIHVLSGRLLIKLSGQSVELPAGHLLVLEKALSHDLKALEESAFLLSISWPHGDDQPPPQASV